MAEHMVIGHLVDTYKAFGYGFVWRQAGLP
jgi:hypothetical protein